LYYNFKNNYPIPFNYTTYISFELPYTDNNKKAQVTIYEVLGKKIKILVDKYIPAGRYQIYWDGINESNNEISRGIYYVQLIHGELQITNKMLLFR
jgi:flagellar hook assembly protein FlgD